jgi:hypothetical protein
MRVTGISALFRVSRTRRPSHRRFVLRRPGCARSPPGRARCGAGRAAARTTVALSAANREFPVERQDVLPLWPRLKSLHANLSAYDAQYVALAEALHVSLITADARVKRSGVARCKVEVFDAHTGRP